MGCDYYVQTDLVIVYIDDRGALSKTRTNLSLEKRYINYIPDENSDDDQETLDEKFENTLQHKINENTYTKMLYENDNWVEISYEKKYKKTLPLLCPRMVKLVKLYKSFIAWERD